MFTKECFLNVQSLKKGYVQTAELIGKCHYFSWCAEKKCFVLEVVELVENNNTTLSRQTTTRKYMIDKLKKLEYIGYKIGYFKH